jgi:hypothetical protein
VRAWHVAAKVLLLSDRMFHPGATSPARLVRAIDALGYNSLKAVLSNYIEYVRGGGLEVFQELYRFGFDCQQCEEIPPFEKRERHNVFIFEK